MNASALPIPTLLAPAVLALMVGALSFSGEINGDKFVEAPMPEEVQQRIINKGSLIESALEENRHARYFLAGHGRVNLSVNDEVDEFGNLRKRTHRYEMGGGMSIQDYEETVSINIKTPYGGVVALPSGGTANYKGISFSDLTTCSLQHCDLHIKIETEQPIKKGLYEYEMRNSEKELKYHDYGSVGSGMLSAVKSLEDRAMDIKIKKNEDNITFTIDNDLSPYYLIEIEAQKNNNTLKETGIFSSDITSSVSIQHKGFDSLTVYAAEMTSSFVESMYRRSYSF